MVVEKGSKVKVEYEGKIEGGEVFDSSGKTGEQVPLEFTVGESQVIKGFEENVLGMELNEEKNFNISPEQGYGEVKEELKKEIPRDALPKDQEPKEGMIMALASPDGHQFPAVIEKVNDESIVLNLNHPLAGKKLNFNVKVVAIE